MSLASNTDQDSFIYLDEPEEVKKPFRVRHSTMLLLALIMVLAAFFRLYDTNFDQGTNQHPDERAIIDSTMRVRWPDSFQQLLDPVASPLNLRGTTEYPWGSLPVYLARGSAWLLDTVLPASDTRPKNYYLNDYHGQQMVGRTLASIFDLITVLLVFLIARRLYSSAVALIATALVAFAATHIQIAHYYISEPFLICFMVGAIYFSVVLMQKPSWWTAAGAGACLGFAIASKVTIAFFGLIIIAAIVLRAIYRMRSRKLGADLDDPVGMRPASQKERDKSLRRHLLGGLRYFLIASLFVIIAFSISEPYALWQFDWSRFQLGTPGLSTVDSLRPFLDSNPWTHRIIGEAGVQGGQADVPFTRQYIGTVPVLYHAEQLVLWGMGVIPGLIAVAGVLLAVWLAFKRKPAEILLLAGAIPYFLTIVGLESKWMRYMLPLVPIVAILGAALLMRGVAWGRALFPELPRDPRYGLRYLQRNFFPIVTTITVAFAFLWATAFANIYTQDHSRVQASAWIYDNVPNGASISGEGWDDRLPVGLPSRVGEEPRDYGARSYRPTDFNLYDDRAPDEELAYLSTQMQQTDYIVLSSNRLYGSIPRLPWRYPVQTAFYQLLYANKLGYVLVHTTQVTPELLGVKIDDQLADESFSVYDHPRVDIFKKVSSLTDEQMRTLFGTALDRPAGEYSVARHGSVSDDKSLMLNGELAAQPNVGDFAWNPLAQEETQWIGVLLWLVAVYLIGFAAMPLVFTLFKRLPDKGYPLAKLTGLLLVSWGAWILASARLIPFTVWSVLLMLLLLAGLGLLLWRLGAGNAILDFYRNQRRLMLFYEAIFLVAFAAFLLVRMLNPDLWHPYQGGEKPMEFGFLNAILRSPWMPPADPFFAGGYINYYYQGQFIVACLIKLVGVDPSIGFNLAIPLLYAATFSGAACLVYNVVAWSQKRRGSVSRVSKAGMAFAALGGVLAIVIGNLYAALQFATVTFPSTTQPILEWGRNLGIITDGFKANFDFWSASRIIPGTINEFPFWTFLFADLHPHLIDMPFTLLVAAFGMNLAFAGRLRTTNGLGNGFRARIQSVLDWLWGRGWAGALNFGVMAVALGALYAINTWDFPTYLGVAGGAVFIALLLSRTAPVARPDDARFDADEEDIEPDEPRLGASGVWTLIATSALSVIVLAVASLAAYLPFLLNFKPFFTKIMPLVDGGVLPNSGFVMRRTSIEEYVIVWAIFVFIAVSYLLVRLWNFPWSAALADIANLIPGRREPQSTVAPILAAGQAFSAEVVPTSIPPRRLLSLALSPSFAGASTQVGFTPAGREDFSSGTSLTDPLPADSHIHADEVTQEVQSAFAPELLEATPTDDVPTIPIPLADAIFGYDPTIEPITIDGAVDDQPILAETPQPIYVPMTTNWVAEAHFEAQRQVTVRRRVEQPGVIPLWAGLGLLLLTTAGVVLQLVTHQLLLALLIALIGGITATLLSTTRSVAALFGGLLLVTALLVSMGVEIVYLADHLSGGDTYRMNTIFKFYIQVWMLFAVGGAAAIYYIIFGLRDRRATRNVQEEEQIASSQASAEAGNALSSTPLAPMALPTYEYTNGSENGAHDHDLDIDIAHKSAPPEGNWLVWSTDAIEDASSMSATNMVMADSESSISGLVGLLPQTEPIAPLVEPVAQEESGQWVEIEMPEPPAHPQPTPVAVPEAPQHDLWKIRWTAPRIAWTAVFALFMVASLIYTVYGTQDRLKSRFANPPSFGTLSGIRYMASGQFGAVVLSPVDNTEMPVSINLKYDYEAINWMNKNIQGLVTIAELPSEYYRNDGMRAATNTGLPMVIGGLHQDEQRADVYARLVGSRRGDMDDFFKTNDVQRALTYISKYSIKYIYLGQLEQFRAGEAGMKKFQQMADPKVGILTQVFTSTNPPAVHGTIIYEVSAARDKDPRTLVGVPVANSGIPGISITPLPTSTPVPPPTPPVDDPQLKKLIADVTADPTNREKRGRLVDWFKDNGYPLEAAKELEIIVKDDPTNVSLWSQLGDMYTAANMPEKALVAWESGRDNSPDNPDAHNKVGIAYVDRKRYDEALKEFQAAVAVSPGFIESWVHMGEVYERKGDVDGAKRAYQSAIDNSHEANGWKDAAQERLAQIK